MHARLIIEQGEGSPATYELKPGETVTLGRSRSNTVVLQDEHASRQHAQITWEGDRWVLQDLGTLNGTFVNGEKLGQGRVLAHGQVIGIADMRLRFAVFDPSMLQTAETTGTVLLPDDLSCLYDFMTGAAKETEPQGLVERTLETLARRTGACLAGFMNLDPDHPVSKMIYPKAAELDAVLSRQLTQRVKQAGQLVWLRGDATNE